MPPVSLVRPAAPRGAREEVDVTVWPFARSKFHGQRDLYRLRSRANCANSVHAVREPPHEVVVEGFANASSEWTAKKETVLLQEILDFAVGAVGYAEGCRWLPTIALRPQFAPHVTCARTRGWLSRSAVILLRHLGAN